MSRFSQEPQQHQFKDEAERLIKTHQRQSEESFSYFRQSLLGDMDRDLRGMETEMKKQLGNVCRKLQNRIRNNYSVGSLSSTMIRFFMEPYVAEEFHNVQKALQKLKAKIFEYIHNFSTNILEKNIKKFNDVSLFYFENKVKHVFNQWYSVTSRSPLQKAQILVTGLRRPQTTWLALGVVKKPKEYGPVVKSINNQQFLGNIYLNGSETLNSGHTLKKNLVQNDVFVIENNNRMIFVYKKKQGRNMDQAFILDDNIDYYFYIGMKGPLFLEFKGE